MTLKQGVSPSNEISERLSSGFAQIVAKVVPEVYSSRTTHEHLSEIVQPRTCAESPPPTIGWGLYPKSYTLIVRINNGQRRATTCLLLRSGSFWNAGLWGP